MAVAILDSIVSVSQTAVSPSSTGPSSGVAGLVTAQHTCTILTRCVVRRDAFAATSTLLTQSRRQYGEPNNSSRPGGPLTQAAFSSNTTNTTFHLVSDNSTVTSLIASISANCTLASNSSTTPSAFNASASDPLPEQGIQYYRASSVVLTLDGYNNTAALTGNVNATPASLPVGVDMTLLNCLNATIGQAVPLFADSASQLPVPHVGLIGLAYVLWCISSFF